MARIINVAAAQYPLSQLTSWDDYNAKITRWVEDAVAKGAQFLVFPEYAALELAALDGPQATNDLTTIVDAVTAKLPQADALHAQLAQHYGVTIIAGSAPVRQSDGRALNVARIFAANGKSAHYDKLIMTPWERDPWAISGGQQLKVFDTPLARIGLVICYDIEFPLLSRALAEAGAEVIFAPSVTDLEHGYWRVRIGAMARALENQLYTVQAPLIGDAPWCLPAQTSFGAAGIYAASDHGFPAGGVLACGEVNQPQWLHSALDLDLLSELRHSGGVKTYQHWPEQPGAGPLPDVEIIDLT